eukprot:TRINITY_DN10474_c0_g2_i3.p1 TRINITY_DN10474_c0_g2~~TRINITY_DN10474_c0_g2_i3.p1  ORF type:complete len:284 (+),score=72.14 TRINITY_DN10474_c0_g2_i3:404-1255(+)
MSVASNSDRENIRIVEEVKTGFWDQFPTPSLPVKSIKKALKWFNRYSPMFLSEMITANSISRRKYLNFLTSLVSVETMFKVVSEMYRIASQVNSELLVQESQDGIPYSKVDFQVKASNELQIEPEFLQNASKVWADVKTEEDLLKTVAIYRVSLLEYVDEDSKKIQCIIAIEFNDFFKTCMSTDESQLKQFIHEAKSQRLFVCNPPIWIFESNYWDVILDFILYSFFNQSAAIDGTFLLSCWDSSLLKKGVYNSISVNLVGYCSYDERFSRLQYTFGFRQVPI